MNIDLSKEDRGIFVPNSPPKRHYIAIVLDRSGSMGSILYPTIEAFNKQIETIRKEADINTRVSLVTFGSEVTPIYFNRTVDRLEELSIYNYQPNGWTAMNDAVGYTIRRLENEAEYAQNSTFLVIIVSDGYENRSTEFTAHSLAQLIKNKQHSGRWTFTYAGANQDLSAVSTQLNIPMGNMFTYDANIIGMASVSATTSRGLSAYMCSVQNGGDSMKDFYSSPTVVNPANTVKPTDKKI